MPYAATLRKALYTACLASLLRLEGGEARTKVADEPDDGGHHDGFARGPRLRQAPEAVLMPDRGLVGRNLGPISALAIRAETSRRAGTGEESGGVTEDFNWLVEDLPKVVAKEVKRIFESLPQPVSDRIRKPQHTQTLLDYLPPGLAKSLHATPLLLMPVLLGFALLALMLFSFVDCGQSKRVTDGDRSRAESEQGGERREPKLEPWSIAGIMALTSYRFYTGFLSSTWMPYLLAMEGRQMMDDRQSFFMGSAKLIYGMSILLNPMFGLVGDHTAVMSHWSGRRLFVLVGVGTSSLGIYGCTVAASIQSVWWYLSAVVLWMLGEAMADVTTETLVPELLPRSQYEISSAIRSLNFLVGGLAGYGALIAFRNVHYSWLYYGYLIVMFICAFLTIGFINSEDHCSNRSGANRRRDFSLAKLCTEAYCMPARYEGGFPRACVSLFVFSLGSAPMFFLLLMVRDIIGITNAVNLQMHFSLISIAFFIAAAVASMAGAIAAKSSHATGTPGQGASLEDQPEQGPEAGAGSMPTAQEEASERARAHGELAWRWYLMVASTVVFGLVTVMIPAVGFLPTVAQRTTWFYVVAMLFGFSFGSVYSRFQECTWSLLPPGVDIANAMGFAAMCKLAGVGFGNFLAGIILDFYSDRESTYKLHGYVIMCICCASVVLISAGLAHSVGRTAMGRAGCRR